MPTHPTRSIVRPQLRSEADSDGFRSVIDDLTVQNKRLKRKLQKYEDEECLPLRDDKLFELRVFGLSPNKKRRLEETLRDFALGLGLTTPPTNADAPPSTLQNLPAHDGPSDGPSIKQPSDNGPSLKPSSVSTSRSRPLDSAYASMSTSGLTSGALQGSEQQRRSSGSGQVAKDRQVESYLSNIASGQLPRPTPVLSLTARKKLAVKKLEQLFTDQATQAGEHSQPIQQQEISNSAARLDRNDIVARGQPIRAEGLREARMLPASAAPMTMALGGASANSAPDDGQESASPDRSPSPQQRPTRPLDLDPDRAQPLAENLAYLRHLGLPSPRSGQQDLATDLPKDSMYLNLLCNMAQLHTMNVTQDFVREALSEYSTRFQLSADGRKVYWDPSRESMQREPSPARVEETMAVSPMDVDGATYPGTNHKRQKVRYEAPGGQSVEAGSAASHGLWAPNAGRPSYVSGLVGRKMHRRGNVQGPGRMSYEPLFFHGHRSDDDSSRSQHSSPNATAATNVSLGARLGSLSSHHEETKVGRRKSSSKVVKGQGAPITFYHQAQFLTDLSGDHFGGGYVSLSDMTTDDPMNVDNLGTTPASVPLTVSDIGLETLRGFTESMGLEDVGRSSDGVETPPGLDFTRAEDSSPQPTSPTKLFHFDASGVGGVVPMDNFAVILRTRHVLNPEAVAPWARYGAKHCFQHKIGGGRISREVKHEVERHGPAAKYDIVGTSHVALPPSRLPAASVLVSMSSEDGLESCPSFSLVTRARSSSSSQGEGPMASTTRPELDGSSCDSDLDSGSDDWGSSIDLLAAARELDPETIAEREREFERHAGPQFLEELPAGSSAATVGGGSGFSSDQASDQSSALSKE